jgi:hypothetical protein
MAGPNLGAASQQTAWMLQKVNSDVQISENLDMAADSLFSQAPTEEIGLQQYRHPIEVEVGGVAGYYQPDGGSYFQGQANQVDQLIVAPLPIMVAISATELARRIAKGGRDVTVDNWIARMISKVKDKTAHTRNAYLQGYNTSLLATIDASYAGGNVIPLVTPPFGGRLLDRNGIYQVTDANFNVIGQVTALDVQKNGVGTIDTVTVDAAPGGTAAGYKFIPIGLATGNPIGVNGLDYIISGSANLEYCGVSRANSYVQSPSYNANGAFLTLGMVSAFMTRMQQALGVARFKQRKRNVWFAHPAQKVSADILGFSKTLYTAGNGKLPDGYDVAVNPFATWMIAGIEVIEDSMCRTDKLRWIDKAVMKRVRYPGSQAFIPGMVEGIFWPRQSGGLWVAESDAMYQDSVNYYSCLPWASGEITSLGVQPILSN